MTATTEEVLTETMVVTLPTLLIEKIVAGEEPLDPGEVGELRHAIGSAVNRRIFARPDDGLVLNAECSSEDRVELLEVGDRTAHAVMTAEAKDLAHRWLIEAICLLAEVPFPHDDELF